MLNLYLKHVNKRFLKYFLKPFLGTFSLKVSKYSNLTKKLNGVPKTEFDADFKTFGRVAKKVTKRFKLEL